MTQDQHISADELTDWIVACAERTLAAGAKACVPICSRSGAAGYAVQVSYKGELFNISIEPAKS